MYTFNNKYFKSSKIRITTLSLVSLFVLSACGNKENTKKTENNKFSGQSITIDQQLKDNLDEFANKPRCKGKFAIYVYDITANKPVYGNNENLALPSASCMKLISGIAGLHLLGTDYRYTTDIYTRGTIKNDTLQGDITLKADLDPQLKGTDLKMFINALHRKGIKKLSGKVYMDLTIQKPVTAEPHWYPWDLSFSQYGLLYKGKERVKNEFKTMLRNQGFQLADSKFVFSKTPKGSKCIFRFQRSIDRVIQRMWKNSSNTQATAMLYTISNHINAKDSTFTRSGINYLYKFVQNDLGLKDKKLVIHDGCGLCTHNHLSPKSLVAALRYGYKDNAIRKNLYTHLSVAGINGTARRLLSKPELRGKLHVKTGTLSHPYGISSLAGFCKASNGHTLAFAIMDSEMSVLDAHVLQSKLAQVLVK